MTISRSSFKCRTILGLLAFPVLWFSIQEAQGQPDPEELFLFALYWQEPDIGPQLFDFFAPDLICTLNGLCNPTGPGGSGDASIFGQKFLDLDRDGTFNEGDQPLNGFPVRLYDMTGALVATAISRDVDLDNSGGIDPMTESGVYLFQNVAAQSYFVGETPPLAFPRTTQNEMELIELPKTPNSLIAEDFDEDGDNDLIVSRNGSASGAMRGLTILRNEGGGVFMEFPESFGGSGDDFQSPPVLADFTLDGRLDIAVGTNGHYYILQQIDGGGFVSGTEDSLGEFVSTVKAANANSDNLPDLIGEVNEKVFIALNLGLDGDTWMGMSDPVLLDATDMESLDVGDIDGDTFPDIVTGLGTIFKNDGDANFTPTVDSGLESISTAASDLRLLDIDGDSDLDVALVNNGFRRDPDFTVGIAKNDGNGNFTPSQTFFSVHPYGLAPIDLENDGDLDLAVRVQVNGDDVEANYLQYLINDGAGVFVLVSGPFVSREDSLLGAVGADLDGQPGDELAITIANTGFGNPEYVAIIDNPLGRTGVEALSGQQVRGPDIGNTQSAAIIEGQKFEDLNFNGVRDPGEVGLNEVEMVATAGNFGMNFKAQATTVDEDLNGDNVIDPETERGRFRLIFEPDVQGENIVREIVPENYLQTVPNNPRTSLVDALHRRLNEDGFEDFGGLELSAWTSADLTNDNAPDMIYAGIFNPEGNELPDVNILQVFVNDGKGLYNDPTDRFGMPEVALVAQEIEFASEVVSIAVGDFDGGGAPDFATLERFQETLGVFLGDGTGQFTETASLSRGQSTGVGELHAVDIDNDSDIDLIAINQSFTRVFLNDGAGNFTAHPTSFGENMYGLTHDAVVTDLNNDTFPDVAVTQRGIQQEDGLYVSLNLGTDGGGVWQGLGDGTIVPFDIGSFDVAPVAAANLDSDPEPELICVSPDDDLLLLDSDGNGAYSIADTILSGLRFILDIDFIDQNKDGLIDVVVAGDEMSFSDPYRDGRFFRSDGQGGLEPLDGRLPFLAEQIAVHDFDKDGDPDIGFISDSMRLGYFDLDQPYYDVEADVGDRVSDILFGNIPIQNR